MEQTKEQKVASLIKEIEALSGMKVEVEMTTKKQALLDELHKAGYSVERKGSGTGLQVFLDYQRDKSGKLKRMQWGK